MKELKPGQINSSKGGWNDYPTNQRPSPPEAQKSSMRKENNQYYLDYLVTKQEQLIDKIEKEASLPTCMSYDYDPTPSGEERLQKILGMIENFKADL